MNKTAIIIIGAIFSLSVSCDNEDIVPDNDFTVIVESTADLACSLPVIRFLDEENEVKERTSLETLTYNAYHLESSLNVTGKKLIIEFGEVEPEDFGVCNTLGIAYPTIAITSARPAD